MIERRNNTGKFKEKKLNKNHKVLFDASFDAREVRW